MRFIGQDGYLKECLLLKGGTAINLAVFSLPRLSVDIDLDYASNDPLEKVIEARKEISSRISAYMQVEGYSLSNKSRFSHNLDSFSFTYRNTGGNADSIKLDLNYSSRAHILHPEKRTIHLEGLGEGFEVTMLHPIELFASKGKALLERAAARDLYDWCSAIETGTLDDDRCLLKKGIVFYASLSGDISSLDFKGSSIQSITFSKIRRDLLPLLKDRGHFNLEEKKEKATRYMQELMVLSAKESEYLDRMALKDYKPELLFEDQAIVERIKNHPMALWRIRK